MPGLYTHTTRATGTILTAAIYNTDHQNHIDNQTPAATDDYSVNESQMQNNTDPYPGGVVSLPTSLAGEIERIRHIISRIHGGVPWYIMPQEGSLVGGLFGYVGGLTMGNWAPDVSNDIIITSGAAMANSNVGDGPEMLFLPAAVVKRIDAAWAFGTNQGGMDTGSVADGNWYYVYLIGQAGAPAATDVMFSLDGVGGLSNLPSGYNLYRCIGAVRREGGSILPFISYELGGGGIYVGWTTPPLDVDLSNTLTTTERTDTVRVPTMPGLSDALGGGLSVVHGIFNVRVLDNASAFRVYLRDITNPDAAPSNSASPLATIETDGAGDQRSLKLRLAMTSSSIRARASIATVDSYRVTTLGWEWGRR